MVDHLSAGLQSMDLLIYKHCKLTAVDLFKAGTGSQTICVSLYPKHPENIIKHVVS